MTFHSTIHISAPYLSFHSPSVIPSTVHPSFAHSFMCLLFFFIILSFNPSCLILYFLFLQSSLHPPIFIPPPIIPSYRRMPSSLLLLSSTFIDIFHVSLRHRTLWRFSHSRPNPSGTSFGVSEHSATRLQVALSAVGTAATLLHKRPDEQHMCGLGRGVN